MLMQKQYELEEKIKRSEDKIKEIEKQKNERHQETKIKAMEKEREIEQ